jgi:hypothetical protein
MSPQPCPWAPLGAFVVPNGQVGTTSDTLSAPVSGRVTGLWADPAQPDKNLYMASAAGGVWHTDDGAVTWTPILDGEATLATGALTVANGVLYIGTGEANDGSDNVAGRGVISIDLATNTRTYDYLPQLTGQVISRVVVDDPAAPTMLYVASSNGLWRKDLAATTWKELPVAGLAHSQKITDVLVNPAGRVYAGVAGLGVFTSDTHDTLVRVVETIANLPTANVGRVSLTACRNPAQTIYAAIVDGTAPRGARLFRCDNAPQATGDNPAASLWTAVTPPKDMEQLWYTNVIAVHPQDPDVLYYGETHLWRSKDGGQNWERSTNQHGKAPGAHADQHALVIEDKALSSPKSFDGVQLWAGNDGGVWRSVDGGGTWRPRNRGLNTMQYFAIATHPTERNIVTAGAQDNGTQRYLGDGAWELADYGDGCYVGFDPVDPTVWYNGYVSYSTDGTGKRISTFGGFQVSTTSGQLGSYHRAAGKAGSANAIGATDEALFYAPFLVVPPAGAATAADLWVGTDRVYYSTSRGDRWFPVTASLLTPPAVPNGRGRGISVLAAPAGAVGRLYAGTSEGHFYRVDQVGGAWSSSATTTEPTQGTPAVPALQAAGMRAGSFMSAIAAARLPSGEDRVVVGVGRNHIVGSATAAFPAGSHLFFSSDSGASFTVVALPNVPVPGLAAPGVPGAQNGVNGLVLDPTNPDLVYIACDTGVFRFDMSTPATPPEPWLTGLPNTVVMGIEIVPSAPRLLRVATHGRGAWETELDPLVAPAVCMPVQLVLRDTLHDDGRSPSTATSPDPFDKDKTLSALASLDIAVDVPDWLTSEYTKTSTVEYTADGQLDYIGFHDLHGGSSPTRGDIAKVHVRVHNRGSTAATQVKVALAWADNSNPLPNLPAGFFAAFPAGQPAGGTSWPAVGTPVTIASIGPGEAGVATFDWPVSSSTPFRVRLLAVVSSAEDPFVDPGETGSAAAALKSRFVAVHDVEMSLSARTWLIVLAAIGVVAVAAVVIATNT